LKSFQELSERRNIKQPDDPSMKYIALTQGQVAIVDSADYDRLIQHNWHAWKHPDTGQYYAVRKTKLGESGHEKRTSIYMHRAILEQSERLSHVDHRDPSKTLDNRRCNLRKATPSQNQANLRKSRANKSGFKGVRKHLLQSGVAFSANISVGGRLIYLGRFASAEAAHAAYCAEAVKHFGEFARFS
jgi:hypothetical protein